MNVSAKAPGVLKALGDHAVVYDYLAVAVAVDRYVYAEAKLADASDTVVFLDDFHRSFRFTREELQSLYEEYKEIQFKTIDDIKRFAMESGIAKVALPYATIAARLSHQYSVDVSGLRVRIKSDIPIGKGYASSAACSTAFAVAATRAGGAWLPDNDMLDVAIDGERITHGKPGAGRIDVSTSYYGGVVSVKKGREPFARKEDIKTLPEILVIDTGPKKSTEVSTGIVAKRREVDPSFVNPRLAAIGEYSERGLEALRGGRFAELGECMNVCQTRLAELGVSSDELDAAIDAARRAGALGAKLSGGGMGGIAIAIADDPDKLMGTLKAQGFDISRVGISLIGAANVEKAKSVMK